MATHELHKLPGGYLITFTCYQWISLIEVTNAYDLIYKWYDILKETGFHILGYVIMPNHVHTLIYKGDENLDLNKYVGSGKRFLAYGMVERLKQNNQEYLIERLQSGVKASEKRKGKRHQVFKLSFDGKWIASREAMENILDYVHHNPVSGRWALVDDFADYQHSSAMFYECGKEGIYKITHYGEFY